METTDPSALEVEQAKAVGITEGLAVPCVGDGSIHYGAKGSAAGGVAIHDRDTEVYDDARPRDRFRMAFTASTHATRTSRPVALGELPNSGRFSVTLSPAPVRSSSSALLPASSPITTCEGKINYPHASSHYPGTVNVTDYITCSNRVARIVLRTYLRQRFDDVYGTVGEGATTDYGAIAASGNAASRNCVNTQYYGEGTVTVTSPPGYSPTTIQQTAYSPYQTISCP